jgi:chromate transporter
MDDRQFADMFAIAQAFPGPNVMLVTLVGYHVAGFWGAAVTTLAMCGPTAVLAGVLTRTWDRFKDAPWRETIQVGLAPISVGLVGASAIVLSQVAVRSSAAAIIAVATAAIAYWTRLNPLWLIALAGVRGSPAWFERTTLLGAAAHDVIAFCCGKLSASQGDVAGVAIQGAA